MTAAKGIHAHDRFKLGLKPTTLPASKLLSIGWRDGVIPPHPPSVDNMTGVTAGLDDNDHLGDCGPTSADNHGRITTKAYGSELDAAIADVLALYTASTTPPFNPKTGANDNGVQMPDLLNAMRKVGLGTRKIAAFGLLKDTTPESIRAAIALFGAVLFAVDLQTAQQTQTDQGYWDYSPSSEWGGHAIAAGRYDQANFYVFSWAQTIRVTLGFCAKQLGEIWVPLWPEVVNSDVFAKTVAIADLAADFESLTDGAWPGATPPAPTPPPAPVADADKVLAQAVRDWVNNHHHTGEAATVAAALKAWRTAKGLT